MLRFAQSPTVDMHIGNLRVALFNYIISKQRKEDFIVRIEDMDKETNIEGKDDEILDILALFKIEYSQIIYQSQNVRFHSAMALQLLHEKKAFSCFCSEKWLDGKKEEAKTAKEPYLYDDACRNLPAELVIDNTSSFTIRINRPNKDINTIDSFIIMDQNKKPTYDFACAIDDLLSNISFIISSEKDKDNSQRQEHIRNSLQYDKKIEYAYLPIISNDNNFNIKWLLEEGYLPEAISNYLILIENETPQEIFTIEEAIQWFDLNKISNSPAFFDIEKLKDINKKHLKNLDAKELSRYVGFADAEIGELARIYLNEVSTTKELKEKIAPIFEVRKIPHNLEEQTKLMANVIKSAPYFEEYEDFKKYVIKETGSEEESFTKSVSLLLTNSEEVPDITNVYKYLKNYLGEIIK